MRLRTVIGVFVGGFLMFALAAPAAAQGAKIDFSGGYQYFRFLEDGGVSVPTDGPPPSPSARSGSSSSPMWAANYEDGDALRKLHTFQGGVEFSGKGKRVVPFVRVLTGVGVFSGFGTSHIVLVFTPESGVKIMANDQVGVQTSVGFPIFVDGDGPPTGSASSPASSSGSRRTRHRCGPSVARTVDS